MTNKDKEFIDLAAIRTNWILIVAIIGAIFWAATMQGQVAEHQRTLIHIGGEGSELKKTTYRMEGKIEKIMTILEEREKKDKK